MFYFNIREDTVLQACLVGTGGVDASKDTARSDLKLLLGSKHLFNRDIFTGNITALESSAKSILQCILILAADVQGNIDVGHVVLHLVAESSSSRLALMAPSRLRSSSLYLLASLILASISWVRDGKSS